MRDILAFLQIDPNDTSDQVKAKIEKLFERVEVLEKKVETHMEEKKKHES